MCFSAVAPQKPERPATTPISSAEPGSTKPDAGVTATRPATAPEITPSTLGLPLGGHSANIQARAAPGAHTRVTTPALPPRATPARRPPPAAPLPPPLAQPPPAPRAHRGPGVEAEPTHPEQRRADHR